MQSHVKTHCSPELVWLNVKILEIEMASGWWESRQLQTALPSECHRVRCLRARGSHGALSTQLSRRKLHLHYSIRKKKKGMRNLLGVLTMLAIWIVVMASPVQTCQNSSDCMSEIRAAGFTQILRKKSNTRSQMTASDCGWTPVIQQQKESCAVVRRDARLPCDQHSYMNGGKDPRGILTPSLSSGSPRFFFLLFTSQICSQPYAKRSLLFLNLWMLGNEIAKLGQHYDTWSHRFSEPMLRTKAAI